MKKLTGIFAAIAVMGSFQASAQTEVEDAAGTNVFEFSPNILTGAYTKTEGSLTGGDTGAVFGPFVRPYATISTSQDRFDLSLTYEFEAKSTEGIGESSDVRIGDNANFYHYLPLGFTGEVNDTLDLKVSAYYYHQTYGSSESTGSNYSELYAQPSLWAQVSDNIRLGVGYNYTFTGNPDGVIGEPNASEMPGALFQQVSENVGQSPRTHLNAGLLLADISLPQDIEISSYLRAGRSASNMATDANAYRFNADTTLMPLGPISATIRYRMDVSNNDFDADTMSNQVRLFAGYELNDQWSIDIDNALSISHQLTGDNANPTYTNNQYLGATYTF